MMKIYRSNLTEKQQDFYDKLKLFVETFGYVPTIREMCNMTGYTSSSTPFTYIKALEEKGYLKRISDRVIKFLR